MPEQLRLHRLRGQALTETTIALPLFMLLLFGVIWAAEASVVYERTQFAVRYSGLISTQVSPYSEWSLYALYANSISPGSTYSGVGYCTIPNDAAIMNSAPFPGPTTLPFFQPIAGDTVGTCSNSAITMSGAAFPQPAIFLYTGSTITANTVTPTYLASVISARQRSATQKFFAAPDMGTMLHCYGGVGTAIAGSLLRQGGSTTVIPAPIVPAGGQLAIDC